MEKLNLNHEMTRNSAIYMGPYTHTHQSCHITSLKLDQHSHNNKTNATNIAQIHYLEIVEETNNKENA